MKSSWRDFEKNTGNLFWGILLLIVSIGLFIAGIVLAVDGDATILFILIPLAVFSFIGSILFLKDAGRAKEIAVEQKQIEDDNYEAVRLIGKIIPDESQPKVSTAMVNKPITSVDVNNETKDTFNIDAFLIKNLSFNDRDEINIPFANINEFLLFIAHNRNRSIVWKKDDKPMELYKKAFKLYEEGNVILSINTLIEALKINPIFITARFEIVNGYATLRRFDLAKTLLLDMQDYIFDQKDCAFFYRRLGYIFAETNQPVLAYTCYRFSQRFEDGVQAKQEIAFIKDNFNVNVNDLDISLILSSNKIPLLNVRDLEELKKQINNVK